MLYDLKHIKFDLDLEGTRSGYRVNFKILYMDERFRDGRSLTFPQYVASNHMFVQSADMPELTRATIFLRGQANHRDNELCGYFFNEGRNALDYYNNVIKALHEWDDNWEGWGHGKPTPFNEVEQLYAEAAYWG